MGGMGREHGVLREVVLEEQIKIDRRVFLCELAVGHGEPVPLEIQVGDVVGVMQPFRPDQRGHALSAEQVVPSGGTVQAADQVEERGFARAAGAHDRDIFAAVDRQVDISEDAQLHAAKVIRLA